MDSQSTSLLSYPEIAENNEKIDTGRGWSYTVFYEGKKEQISKKPTIMTIHDMGSNHKSFYPFLFHPNMNEIRNRTSWIHVEMPGQSLDDPILPDNYKFPTLQELAENLRFVLLYFNIEHVVGFGEGAGANILTRFAMVHPSQVVGLVLVHPTSTVAGLIETCKDKIINWKLCNGMNPTAENYLLYHKFGGELERSNQDERLKLKRKFSESLHTQFNSINLRHFINAFLNRTDISGKLETGLKTDTLLVCGDKSSYLHSVYTMFSNMNKKKSSMLNIDGVGNVICEAPEKLSTGFLYFLQGIGYIPSVQTPNIGKARKSSLVNMTEADKPRRYTKSKVSLQQ